MTDGTSNTILCIETDEDNAAYWTKPQDLKLEETGFKKLFRFQPDRTVVKGKRLEHHCFAAIADGSVVQVRKTADEKELLNFIKYNDQNVVDLDAITK